MKGVPFNKPWISGNERRYLDQLFQGNQSFAGAGPFSKLVEQKLAKISSCSHVMLTSSCTTALEMAAILADIQPGDEVIMPSFTFPSTANAFVLRGATPVFVDIREDTMNLNEELIAQAVTSRTKAIVPMHYAGSACQMEKIMEAARSNGLVVIEDAAQALGATYQNKPLGSWGSMGAISFHETKNIHCGEGGALLLNDNSLFARAEIIRDKGTNRAQWSRNRVDHYCWMDIGSSFLTNEVSAAFLLAQLETLDKVTDCRLTSWRSYHEGLASLEAEGLLRRPGSVNGALHNGHIYYILLKSSAERDRVIQSMLSRNIQVRSHYEPLHTSPAGSRYGRTYGKLVHTEDLARRILRLPLWAGMDEQMTQQVIVALREELTCN